MVWQKHPESWQPGIDKREATDAVLPDDQLSRAVALLAHYRVLQSSRHFWRYN